MNPVNAAKQMIPLILKSYLPDKHPWYGKDPLLEMVKKIENGEVVGEKAHRWIGWIQGCVCVEQGATLEELKWVNKRA